MFLYVKNVSKVYDLTLYLITHNVMDIRYAHVLIGCEATCNGPYGGAWSKTMIGYGEESSHFVLELTYNYGIASYEKGNDLLYITLALPVALVRARALNFPIENNNIIIGPDGYKYKIIDNIPHQMERFVCITLRTDNLPVCKSYYNDILQLDEFSIPDELQYTISHSNTSSSVLLGFAANQTKLQFVQVNDNMKLNHAKSSGRIAFSCYAVPPIYELIQQAKETVLTPPLTLPVSIKGS